MHLPAPRPGGCDIVFPVIGKEQTPRCHPGRGLHRLIIRGVRFDQPQMTRDEIPVKAVQKSVLRGGQRVGLDPEIGLRGGVILAKVYASLQSPKFVYAMLEKFANEVIVPASIASDMDSMTMDQDGQAFIYENSYSKQGADKSPIANSGVDSNVNEWLGPIEAAASGFSSEGDVFGATGSAEVSTDNSDSLEWLREEEGLGFVNSAKLGQAQTELEDAEEAAAARAAKSRAAAAEAAAEADAHEAEAKALASELQSTKSNDDVAEDDWKGLSEDSDISMTTGDFRTALDEQIEEDGTLTGGNETDESNDRI